MSFRYKILVGRGERVDILTNTLLLIPILIHPSVRIQLSGEYHLGEFPTTSRGTRFLAEDAVEFAVEDAGVSGGEAEED